MPFLPSHLAFEGRHRDVADRPMMLLRIAPQALVQGVRKVLDLKICHTMIVACSQHAVEQHSATAIQKLGGLICFYGRRSAAYLTGRAGDGGRTRDWGLFLIA